MPVSRAHRGARNHGFTLIEIMVVLGLVALAVAVASVGLSKGLSGMRMRSAGHDLVAALRYTRGQAIVAGEERRLEIDVEKRTYQAPKRPLQELPKGLELKVLTAAEERTGDTTAAIRFFPDGSSTGGRVRLVAGESASDVEIAWLTGEIRLRERTGDER